MPLETRRKKELLSYGSRISHLAGHPVREYIVKTPPIYHFLSDHHKLSALDELHKMLDKLQIKTNQLPGIPMRHKYIYQKVNCHATLADEKKEKRSEDQWKALYYNLIDSLYPNHIKKFF